MVWWPTAKLSTMYTSGQIQPCYVLFRLNPESPWCRPLGLVWIPTSKFPDLAGEVVSARLQTNPGTVQSICGSDSAVFRTHAGIAQLSLQRTGACRCYGWLEEQLALTTFNDICGFLWGGRSWNCCWNSRWTEPKRKKTNVKPIRKKRSVLYRLSLFQLLRASCRHHN